MFLNYLKISWRHLVKYRAHSLINIAGLATGIASCLLILLWVQDELSFDRFHDNAEQIFRVVRIDRENPAEGIARVGGPWGPELQKNFPEIADFVRFRYLGRTLFTYNDIRSYELEGLYADPGVFNIFSFETIYGDLRNALSVPDRIVLTQSLAQKYFGSANPVGQWLRLDRDRQMQVTAVVADFPANSHFHFDFLVSFSSHNVWYLSEWQMNNYHLYLLLNAGTSVRNLETKIEDFVSGHLPARSVADARTVLQPLTEIHLHSNLFREFEANGDIGYLYLFSAVAFLILLIACFNFVNLSTARSSKRSREVGVRKVIGARRSQLVGQFLGESFLQIAFAALFAMMLVEIMLPYFNTITGKQLELNFVGNPSAIAGFAALVLLVSLIGGLYPAFFLSKFKPVLIINNMVGGRSNSRLVLRKVLVIFQFSVTIILIIASIVIFQQLDFMKNKRLGFDKDQLMLLRLVTPELRERSDAIEHALQESPYISGTSKSSGIPGSGDWGMPFRYEGMADPGRPFSSRVLVVNPDFIPTMGINLIAGRNFSDGRPADLGRSYIINQAAATALGWGDSAAVGKQISRPIERGEDGEWRYESGSVIAVMEDFHFRSMHQEIAPMIIWMDPASYSYLSVRLNPGEFSAGISAVAGIWQKLAPEFPFDYTFLDEVLARQYQAEERMVNLVTPFSTLAIIIACLGLFGLASMLAEQRIKEIGIRKVLGATILQLLWLFIKDIAKWIFLAILVAWPLSYWLMERWLADFAFRVDISPAVLVGAALLGLLIALTTISTHAIKTARANPIGALRTE